ncbi:hypothetical protein BX661DRAFT_63648 [Kickxella alabastrina]|uniref:uncharacterized protein n=1 Tax=Kickxella alabastrina TaxID=61397 RepID=UPI00222016B3|nr:uncharacterized protein BX661DRAFT_63648 [Kickxella alabastrina]KAI7833645.1 hypothetical protein BX661DRAFT_63648 [Kickxella alabastrina]
MAVAAGCVHIYVVLVLQIVLAQLQNPPIKILLQLNMQLYKGTAISSHQTQWPKNGSELWSICAKTHAEIKWAYVAYNRGNNKYSKYYCARHRHFATLVEQLLMLRIFQ